MAELLVAAGVSAGTAATIASVASATAAAAAVAGTGYGIYSAVSQSNQQADLARAAQQQAEIEGEQKQQAARFEENQFRRRIAVLQGQQQAAYAAAGVDTGSGSPLFQELDTARQAELEALNVRRTGQVGKSASDFEAKMMGYRASYAQSQIPGQVAGGILSGTSSLLGNLMRASRPSYPQYNYGSLY